MKIEITVEARHVMIILLFIAAVSTMGLVVAYGGSAPLTMGHSWGEIDCSGCITGSNIADNSVTSSKIGCDSILCRDSGGNIGIGTDVPGAKLDVNGTIRGATYGFGGMYAIEDYGACRSANPFTDACSCPAGFSDMSTGTPVYNTNARWLYVHICYK